MSKVGAGVTVLFLVWLISARGFSVFLGFLALLFWLGQLIGKNDVTLVLYIIATMAASYLLPVVMTIRHKQFRWLIIVPLVASFVFAIPSSFIALAGCEAGHEGAVWAMRAIPAILGGELVLAPQPMSCKDF